MIKIFSWVVFLALGLQASWGFALLGPLPGYTGYTGDPWQVALLDYAQPGDVGGPRNYQEEYRRNVPVLYYAYDDNFSGVTGEGWFGLAGEHAVDQAFDILNSLPKVDNINLSAYPFQSQSLSPIAQNLYLTDLKSFTLFMLLEQLALAQPERYIWALHNRVAIPGSSLPCPENMTYLVIQRNYDPVASPLNQLQYSAYVNNVLYTYYIEDNCGQSGYPWTARTVPLPEDTTVQTYTSVASENLQTGGFYTGLSRDDVGGLIYLLSTNNVNYEAPALGSVLIGSTTIGQTNLSPQLLLYTSNYNAFWWSARTNAPTTLSNLYPGLVILPPPSNTFTITVTPNVIAYYTNNLVLGNPPTLVVVTNSYTTNALEIYFDTFANVVTNWGSSSRVSSSTSAQLVTVTVSPGLALGNPLVTNTTIKTVIVPNQPSGEFYINTNYLCNPDIFVSPQPTGFPIAVVSATTNLLYAASNALGYFTSQSLVTYSTTHVYVVQQQICTTVTTGTVTNAPGYFQGVGGIKFVKLPDGLMDPITHLLTTAVTNQYTNFVFNPVTRKLETRIFQRVVTTPDIIISAADMTAGPASYPVYVNAAARPIPQFEVAYNLPGLAGPGVIDGLTTFTFNKVGPLFSNGPFPETNGFLNVVNQFTQSAPLLQWASFDGSTNAPILYPSGTSVEELENEMVISITPASLPDGTNGVAYAITTFSATGGTSPYTWSLAGTSLPWGLTLSPAGVLSGTPYSNPPGIYDFTIQATDSSSPTVRVVALNYTITIH